MSTQDPPNPESSAAPSRPSSLKKPPLRLQPTTLWDYPSQHYGDELQGDPNFRGATPSYVIWNLLERYTPPGAVVLDPCCGSGTTLDVCADTDRCGLGFDLSPQRDDIQQADARELPLDDASVDFVFIDPPYSTHLQYSEDPRCIGKLSAAGGAYIEAMEQVIAEIDRVLKPNRHMALYVSDSYVNDPPPKGRPDRRKKEAVRTRGFFPIGFDLFARLRRPFIPIDVVAVTRHNATLDQGNYRMAAEEGNFFLRGFNYLFIMKKPAKPKAKPPSSPARAGSTRSATPPTGSTPPARRTTGLTAITPSAGSTQGGGRKLKKASRTTQRTAIGSGGGQRGAGGRRGSGGGGGYGGPYVGKPTKKAKRKKSGKKGKTRQGDVASDTPDRADVGRDPRLTRSAVSGRKAWQKNRSKKAGAKKVAKKPTTKKKSPGKKKP